MLSWYQHSPAGLDRRRSRRTECTWRQSCTTWSWSDFFRPENGLRAKAGQKLDVRLIIHFLEEWRSIAEMRSALIFWTALSRISRRMQLANGECTRTFSSVYVAVLPAVATRVLLSIPYKSRTISSKWTAKSWVGANPGDRHWNGMPNRDWLMSHLRQRQ